MTTNSNKGTPNKDDPKKDKNNAHKKDEFETRAIHFAQEPDPITGAIANPIDLSSTFARDAIGKSRQFEYSRSGNPTRARLETCFADLEGAQYGFAFASGIASIDAILRILKHGDHIVVAGVVYGGTMKLLTKIYQKNFDLEVDIVDISNPADLEPALKKNTRMVWMESPANPLFNIVDLKAVAELCKSRGILTGVDNTVATPYLQNPLKLGIDVVAHSATKYMGGHSDILGGLAATSSEELAEHIGNIQNIAGAVLAPFDSYLVLRGLKTLAVRMDRHFENAMAIAKMLEEHPKVTQVNYSGLSSHPGHEIAAKQMRNFGAMLSFCVDGGRAEANNLITHTRIISLAESLGAVESLISHPATMSHAIIADTEWAVPENLVRLSVGIENQADLINDLSQALSGI